MPCLGELMADADVGYPCEGAKEHYILDIEDCELAFYPVENNIESCK